MLGVIIAQLMRLQHSVHPNPVLGFYVISVPLASACHIAALLVSIIGSVRFFHWQKQMALGKAVSAGWEVWATFIMTAAVGEDNETVSTGE